MAKIRHIAIKVEDQEKTAEFYKKTFGMTEAWRGPVRDDGNRAIYLTDGYINMAVLPARGGREGHRSFRFPSREHGRDSQDRAGLRGEKRSRYETARRPLCRNGRARSGRTTRRRDGAWVEVVRKLKGKIRNAKFRISNK